MIGANRDRNHTDSWVRVRQETLVGESDEQGGLPNSGIACGQSPPDAWGCQDDHWRINLRGWVRRTGDDEFEDVIPTRSSHYE